MITTEIGDWTRLPSHPLVSVVMSTYNHGPYIAQAIEGVAMQVTGFQVELLIGEDCSTDDTLAVAMEYQQNHPHLVRIVTADRNVGGAENFRRVFEKCRGKYIAFCEGDDYWCDEAKLQEQVDILERQPQVSVVFSDFAVADFRSGRWQVHMEKGAFDGLQHEELRGDVRGDCLDGRFRTLTAIYRRQVIEAIYRKGLPRSEYPFGDNFLLGQAAIMGEFERIDGIRAVYRRSPNSATRSNPRSSLTFLQACRRFKVNFPAYFPERPDMPLFDTTLDDVNICRAAVAAIEPAAFDEAYARLDAIRPPPIALRVARLIMRFPSLLKAMLAVRRRLRLLGKAIGAGN